MSHVKLHTTQKHIVKRTCLTVTLIQHEAAAVSRPFSHRVTCLISGLHCHLCRSRTTIHMHKPVFRMKPLFTSTCPSDVQLCCARMSQYSESNGKSFYCISQHKPDFIHSILAFPVSCQIDNTQIDNVHPFKRLDLIHLLISVHSGPEPRETPNLIQFLANYIQDATKLAYPL